MLEDARGKCRSLVKGGFGSIFSIPIREMTEEKLEELGLKRPQGKLLNAILGENGKFELSSQSNFSNYHNSSSRRVDKNPESWARSRSGSSNEPQIQVIEWHMMEKSKFYPLSMMSSFSIRCLLYPFTVVKTCLQVQQKNNVYSSMFDAYKKIYRSEGIKGLYKGFWISAFQIVSGVCYVSTYEGVRHFLLTNDVKEPLIRAVVAGCCASIVGQTFIVPFDVISQHIMVLGQATDTSKNGLNPLNINYINRSKSEVTRQIIANIYKRDGFKGFYRGYCASLGTYVPNSTLWWGFYQFYQEKIINLLPKNSSHLMVQCISATLGGFTTTIITNPLDVCRARIQVQRIGSFSKTFSILWQEEGIRIFTKGLSARITQSILFSFAIILGYETIKRFSVKEDYQEKVRW